ncbi:SprT family protein [Staphylococcus felis]|uniref:SprT family protein n=1 Tax=Staphylococcus felis TaxID=46127 RepID=UPI000E238E0F|nr:SprT family protein [Staphylococcus felis]REH96679.1 SprT family protein [Staphylococcus felis]REI03944.1 SprT family protein [Staphylococcus felis]REI20883.1 SprT family protein [Staphylococcus felis]REI33229.1 SprT family protein [Staphylococcus felis]
MNNQKLQALAEQIAITDFNDVFQHKIYFNHRLRSTGGRYLLQTHHIEINPKQYEYFGFDAVVDIIKHELCHYFLHLNGKGYQHRDQDFKRLSQKVGAPRFCKPIQPYEERVQYHYKCQNCKQDYFRIRKVNLNIMRCGKCKGQLKRI